MGNESIERINTYKSNIIKMIRVTKSELRENLKDKIQSLLDLDFTNHKITEEEYDILNDFLEEILEKQVNIDLEGETQETRKNLKEEVKVNPSIDVITIYKGKFREVPPKREKSNDEREEDER